MKALVVIIIFFIGFASAFALRMYLAEDAIPVLNEDYAPTALQLIDGAEKSVHLVMYQMKFYDEHPEGVVRQLENALVRAHNRGVDVKIIIEGGAEWNDLKEEHEKTFGFFEYYNISVKYDEDNVTTHAKVLIMDGTYVLLGSTNWGYYSLTKNNEANVLVKDPVLAMEFEEYFKELWG
jgi:phosphatidylserine/phosphatidylglycerophosphate/cardiolipin synthase-like enzyme